MKLARIVDSDIADPWVEHSRLVRSALDCFAPIAITIRNRSDGAGLLQSLDYPNVSKLQAKHSRPR